MGEITLNRDAERVPLSSAVRKKQTNKRYNYYGASGVIDKVDNYLFEDRLLLVGEDGANLLSRSKDNAFFAEGRYWVNNHAHVIDSTDKLILDYVAIVINSTPLDKYITGSAQPKFTQDNLNNFPIPLPPLAEQRRIVAEVEKWFALIDDLETNKQDLQSAVKQVRAKVLDLAIHGKLVPQDPADEPAIALLRRINPHYTPSDTSHYQNVPFDIPASWKWVRLGEIYNHNTGKALNSKDKTGRLMDYITTSNLYWNRFELDVVKQMPFTDKDLERCVVTKGDLLVCEGGDIGRAAIWNYDYDICIQNHIHRLRGKIPLCNLFYYNVFREYKITNRISSKGTTIQGLSSKEIDALLIPLPPLAEQKRIVSEIERVFAVLDTIEESLR